MSERREPGNPASSERGPSGSGASTREPGIPASSERNHEIAAEPPRAEDMEIAVLVFDRITALDAIGPYEVLSRLPDAELRWVGLEAGPVRTDKGLAAFVAEATLADVPRADVLVVPGGFGTRALIEEPAVLDWVRAVHETTTWTTSVCTGSLVLAAAGLLDGVDATTHWAAFDLLAKLGAHPVAERVVERGKIMTAAGVSSGIDMALTLAARIAGDDVARAIQLGIEYDPQPPFDSGSLEKAPPEIVDLVRSGSLSG